MTKKKKRQEISGQKKRKFEIHEDFDLETYGDGSPSSLEIFRIGHDEKAGVLFTRQHQVVYVHYCGEPEIKGYVICNIEGGSDHCLLCRIGRKKNKRLLFPIISLETENVEILSVSDSLRPYALLPQIQNILEAEKKLATFFSHENYKYTLTTHRLKKGHRKRAASVIKPFSKSWTAQHVDLSSVYQRIKNSTLESYTEIKKMADLKGIDIDELDD